MQRTLTCFFNLMNNPGESIGDLSDGGFNSLTDVTARVEVVKIPRERPELLQIVAEHFARVCADFFLCGADVHRVRAVHNQLAEIIVGKILPERSNIIGRYVL